MEEPIKINGEVEVDLAVRKEPAVIKQLLKSGYAQLILPGAILLAALIISGSLIYTTKWQGARGTGPTGNNQPGQQAGAPVDIKPGAYAHTLGNKNAKVTIVEFADFRCPFCERFYQQSEKQLLQDYVNTGKAQLVFKHYAFLGQQSTWAAEASECAGEQGKFWEFHNWLYENQASESDLAYYSKVNLIKYSAKVGLNVSQFSTCLNSDKYAKRVADDLAEGQKYGVTGTPTVFINGQRIVGAQPYASFQAVVDGLLKK